MVKNYHTAPILRELTYGEINRLLSPSGITNCK
jgi:hypothetical protein